MANNEYQKKEMEIFSPDNSSDLFEIWKLPLRWDGKVLTNSIAYSLMITYTFNEAVGVEDIGIDGADIPEEEIKALACALLLSERQGIREFIFKYSSVNPAYNDVEQFDKYYRWLIRDILGNIVISTALVLNTLIPNCARFIDKFDMIRNSIKKVDVELYRTYMSMFNVYLMNKLDKMSNEEKQNSFR